VSLRPRDWLLLLFDGAEQPLDRVRIQKSMFLFAERSKAPDSEKYAFTPYHYGPFSFDLYPDLDRLVGDGLLRQESDPRSSSPRYSLTSAGRQTAAHLQQDAPADRAALLRALRDWVTARPFGVLLDDLYRMYPRYAVNSVFRKH
jgi:uncharacterized protein YwgA